MRSRKRTELWLQSSVGAFEEFTTFVYFLLNSVYLERSIISNRPSKGGCVHQRYRFVTHRHRKYCGGIAKFTSLLRLCCLSLARHFEQPGLISYWTKHLKHTFSQLFVSSFFGNIPSMLWGLIICNRLSKDSFVHQRYQPPLIALK